MYLETSVLLAIAYLRAVNLPKAKPIIQEVLKNDQVIKNERRRMAFRKIVIEKFDTEALIVGLTKLGDDKLLLDEVSEEATKLSSLEKEEIIKKVGEAIPKRTKEFIYYIHDFSHKQLNSAEKLLLPAAEELLKDENAGEKFITSFKKELYKALCDSDSEIYKNWINSSFEIVSDKRYIATAVIATLSGFHIGIKALAVSVTSFILKLGIAAYCDRFKPKSLRGVRSTKKLRIKRHTQKSVKKMLAKNRVDSVFIAIEKIIGEINDDYFINKLIMYQSQWNRVREDINIGVINDEEKYIQVQKIKQALLELIDEIPDWS